MSGYLTRLLGNTARPPRRLHPLVGSIFYGPAREGHAEVALSETAQPALSRDTPMARQGPPPRATEPRDTPAARRPDPIAGVDHRAPPPARGDEPPARGAQVAPGALSGAAEPARLVAAGEAPTTNLVPATTTPTALLVESWFDETGGAAESVAPPRTPSPQAAPRHDPVAPGRRAIDATVPAAAVQLDPQDIQINIGRIEVVAAPPAPMVRAPPMAAPRSTSLADYLGRHGGRPR